MSEGRIYPLRLVLDIHRGSGLVPVMRSLSKDWWFGLKSFPVSILSYFKLNYLIKFSCE